MCGLRWRLLAVGGKPDAALSQRLSSHGLAYMPLEAYKYKIYPWIQIRKRHVKIQDKVNYAVSESEERVTDVTTLMRMSGCTGL